MSRPPRPGSVAPHPAVVRYYCADLPVISPARVDELLGRRQAPDPSETRRARRRKIIKRHAVTDANGAVVSCSQGVRGPVFATDEAATACRTALFRAGYSLQRVVQCTAAEHWHVL